ncbi:hypothetical protein [Sporosarcina cascadiensis]|uniref:hypothetical protein n=1 Tax=Sporosarcina cascadiensis TaxID=2660747 RepID=UPI001891CD0D|nr:hypothetical protein [Sporosarcina cascadiensis]
MNNKKYGYIVSVLFVLLMTSGCASGKEPDASDTIHAKPSETNQGSPTKVEDANTDPQKEVLIIIDQTPKPTEGNSFDFVVKQVPEGFTLAEMEWNSKKHRIVNTVLEAKAHGANGEDGFYISGNGQFSGFIYPDTMRGDEGEVVFRFTNSKGKEVKWKKNLTLMFLEKEENAADGVIADDKEAVKAEPMKEILVIIDQTPKPTEGNSFDFVVKQVPEGFTLAEMEWNSEKHRIADTVQTAREHGANGEDGFYISGNGQFSGFIYPDTMKGEQGEVVFLFTDGKGKKVKWKKNVILNPSATSQKESKKEVVAENPQETLEIYMQAIASQNAEAIVGLYGGSYQGLRNLFPETDANDNYELIKQYLELGPKISLETILSRTEVSKGVYTFVVAFKNEDGTRFQTREFDTITATFTYTVKKVNGKLKVMELSPYQA